MQGIQRNTRNIKEYKGMQGIQRIQGIQGIQGTQNTYIMCKLHEQYIFQRYMAGSCIVTIHATATIRICGHFLVVFYSTLFCLRSFRCRRLTIQDVGASGFSDFYDTNVNLWGNVIEVNQKHRKAMHVCTQAHNSS